MRLASVILFFTLLGCSKRICTTPAQPTPIRLVNSSGEDLLNPLSLNSYSINDIRMSYVENGSIMYTPVSIGSIPGANIFFLLNDLPWISQNGRTFYLQLSNVDVDTIYMRSDQVTRDGCAYFQLIDFKYNNVAPPLKYFPGGPAAYEIIK